MKLKNYLFVATAALLLASCKQSGKSSADIEYPVETVGTSQADMQTTYPATIKGIQDVEIRPKVSGFITKLCVHEGQTVKAGQLLFVIDNTTYQATVRQAQASLNSARAQMNTAKLTYDNNKKLFDSHVIGQFELQSARNSYLNAQAAVAQAQALLASAKENLSFCYVKSPANGVVGNLPFKEGALVSATSEEPLTTVSDISTMEVYFSMTEKDILSLTKKAGGISSAINAFPAVKLQLADGSVYAHNGKVTKVSGVIDAATGSVSMIARFANPEHLLKSGASGSVVVPYSNASAIMIPQTATSEIQNKVFVYVVDAKNKAKYTEITVDPQNDGKNYVVTSGLKAGDRIVLKGLSTLTDGMEIKPITLDQYNKKIAEAEKLGENQKDASSFANAMK